MSLVLQGRDTKNGFPLFYLRVSGQDPSKVYGAVHDPKTGYWLFPAANPFHTRVVNDLRVLYPDLVLSKGAQDILDSQNSAKSSFEKGSLDNFTTKHTNYAHQNEALSALIWNPRYGLFLGRGLGKTKIVVDLLSYLQTLKPGTKALILALRVNVYTWVDEFAKFSNGSLVCMPLRAQVSANPAHKETIANATALIEAKVHKDIARKYGPIPPDAPEGLKRARELVFDKALKRAKSKLPSAAGLTRVDKFREQLAKVNPSAVVVTYETAAVSLEALALFDYDVIIADESHKLRGHNSGITKAAIALADRAPRRVLVTGTPNLGDPLHLWGQLRFLGKFLVPDFWSFKKRHEVVSPWNTHIITGYQNVDKLNKLVSGLSIQREAEECLDLPDRVFQHITVDATPELRQVYNTLVTDKELVYKTVDVGIDERIVELGKLAQLSTGFFYVSRKDRTLCDNCDLLSFCTQYQVQPYTKDCKVETQDPGNDVHWVGASSPVVDAVVDLVGGHLDDKKKVIVWAKHVEVLEKLSASLRALCTDGNYLLRYDSTTTDPSLVEKAFNEDSKAAILLAQISMGIGVTFKAPVMVYAEVDWRLDTWLQSLDRNFGIRAKGFTKLLVQTVSIRNSLADFTLKLLEAKCNVADLFVRRPDCGGCDQSLTCVGKGIAPFKEGCKYKSTADRTTVRSSKI